MIALSLRAECSEAEASLEQPRHSTAVIEVRP